MNKYKQSEQTLILPNAKPKKGKTSVARTRLKGTYVGSLIHNGTAHGSSRQQNPLDKTHNLSQ